jgi:hypothetical protein
MTVTFNSFVSKWSEDFSELDEVDFNQMISTVRIEIALINWGMLRDDALEMLLGHKLLMKQPRTESEIKSFERTDEGYSVEYKDAGSALSSTKYGIEYERLMNLITSTESPINKKNASRRSWSAQRYSTTRYLP